MQLHDVTDPGIMISQVWPKSREKEGDTLHAIENVFNEGFFKRIQTVDIPFALERKEIASIIQENGMPMTYCLARVLNDNKLNLSDLDGQNRRKSYNMVIECLEHAKESGANAVSLISGPVPKDITKRKDALIALESSLADICQKAQLCGIKIIIEPLDFYAHKKNTLGTTQEAIFICDSLKKTGRELYLCVDTAHLFLNGEQVEEAMTLAAKYTPEFHFCNCVTDKSNSSFGDNHIQFGEPGVLGINEMSAIMRRMIDLGYFSLDNKPGVFCEVTKRSEDNSIELMKYCRHTLESAWEQCNL